MLNSLKIESNKTLTENGAAAYISTFSDCLDLFSDIGAIRGAAEEDITERFQRAYAEDAEIAMKILFFGRDVREGLGERRVFRIIINWLAKNYPDTLRRNLKLIPEYGRFDDILALMYTPCENDAVNLIKEQLKKDSESTADVSLLAKWLPSVNASNDEKVRLGKRIAALLGMNNAQYRKTLSSLRQKIGIVENNLREKDYSFEYSKVPSGAMFKYRSAFWKNDRERYSDFLALVHSGKATVHTDTLTPYDIIKPCFKGYCRNELSLNERNDMNTRWEALRDFATDENAIAVVDGSGSMYSGREPLPITVALSLGIYFAERNKGAFHNHFITFSEKPRLIEIKGGDIAEKVAYCAGYNEVANTNIRAVFELILKTAIENSVPQEDMPSRIYIISDMEFDCCAEGAGITNFAYAEKLFEDNGYKLPQVVFWQVSAVNRHRPVIKNEAGVALVSGCSPKLFSMVASGELSPYSAMLEIINSERYRPVSA